MMLLVLVRVMISQSGMDHPSTEIILDLHIDCKHALCNSLPSADVVIGYLPVASKCKCHVHFIGHQMLSDVTSGNYCSWPECKRGSVIRLDQRSDSDTLRSDRRIDGVGW